MSLENACGIAIEACQFYDHWERDLILNVFDNSNYQQLIDLSEHVFRNPIFITNWQGKVPGYTKNYADAPIRDFWKDIVRNESLPISCLQNLRRSPYHQILTCENQANLLYFEEQDYRCILGLVHSNKTELAATLYHYLIYERNTTLTAQKLYIHRNTLQHRIHKIHELIDVDLDDVNIRLHLIVSYQIVHAHSCNFC